jgi:beta-glucosidase/6-phospho-beta-glucosidase/beta-galactosidase
MARSNRSPSRQHWSPDHRSEPRSDVIQSALSAPVCRDCSMVGSRTISRLGSRRSTRRRQAGEPHFLSRRLPLGRGHISYQVEGAVNEDGRGPSIWDRFVHTPGMVADGSNADVANDHFHLYKEDVQLIKAVGARAYRFSIAWPRIFPDGSGAPNPRGLDFYNRLVDELLANGIEPFATLYHWDLPQTLQGRLGGWLSRDTAKSFADYAGYVAERLSDRAKHFFTISTPRASGYLSRS